jgi:hypothetical protein
MAVLENDHRDAIYRYAITDLEDAGDIATLLKAGKTEEAQEARCRFEQAFWLLDELGWATTGEQESYEVEFSEDSYPILGRFRRMAGATVDKSEVDFTDQTLIDALYVFHLCDGVLGGSEADATSC